VPRAEQIVDEARKLCVKFIYKVDVGRARSEVTYNECKALLALINQYALDREERTKHAGPRIA